MAEFDDHLEGQPLHGIHWHIHAVLSGENVEERLALIRGSNSLTDEQKRVQEYFLQAFCLHGALNPLGGQEIDLGDGYSIRLNCRREDVCQDGMLPGSRVDGEGWLVIEGQYRKDGRPGLRFDERGFPLWPLMVRNPPVSGRGPWGNFLPQALDLLRQGAEVWQYGD